jgi:putative ABC transport system permease protein
MSKMGLRKALLVVQFSLSMIFVLSVIVLYKQMNLFMQNDNGFAVENRLIIHKGETSAQALKTELEKQSNIISVTMASHVPMTGINYGSDFKKSLQEKESMNVNYFSVDEDYLEHMGLTLVAGNFFTEQAGASNKNFIILNEEAVKRFQFGNPIDALGKSIYMVSDSTEKQIIGVVKDYQHEFLAERLEPLALVFDPDQYAMIQVAYTGSYLDAAGTVEKVWAGINPGLKLDMKELSVHLGKMYEIIFGTIVKVLGFIAFLAITISCLGLLGMATYTIETRKKEIAMRKILGSSNRALIYILSKGYFTVLLLALVIAIPAAYFLNTFWLQNLATHVTVDLVTIGLGTLMLILLGVFTIGSQTLQAIVVNPVENLKNE